jgi:transcriptional accessory protein Tex/SPT6
MSAPGERDWWDLNEQGTILHGERSGDTVRLGDPIEVQVQRVDVSRGRVDLVRSGGQTANAAAEPRRGAAHPKKKRTGRH